MLLALPQNQVHFSLSLGDYLNEASALFSVTDSEIVTQCCPPEVEQTLPNKRGYAQTISRMPRSSTHAIGISETCESGGGEVDIYLYFGRVSCPFPPKPYHREVYPTAMATVTSYDVNTSHGLKPIRSTISKPQRLNEVHLADRQKSMGIPSLGV